MILTWVDWTIVVFYFLASLAVGIHYYRRAGTGTGEFFLSGRSLPWWLAGTSMVATTFAADTPLAVAGLVARDGIAGNWIWWNAAIGGVLTVFFFARLWRRAGILTDVEFVERRYAGRPAALLRGFRALYLGVALNCIIVGWVNLAMAKILLITMGWDRLTAVLASLAITGVYTSISGLWGVVVTDFFQFVLAMSGTVALAWFALQHPLAGGSLETLAARLPADTLAFAPRIGDAAGADPSALGLPLVTFLTYVGVQWWASWYPGQEPGGGGYVVQRVMSAKDERHALLATLWFTIAHYCVRPWPWILVGLVSVLAYPGLEDKESGYVLLMRDVLPPGWRGLLLGAFFAAYMSTISTQLNWGTSYVVNDFYRRFVRPQATEGHYVWVSRLATLLLMALSGIVTFYLESIRQAWEIVLEAGAGIGLVLILRWYWWRVNAWSEIAAMIAPAVGLFLLRKFTSVAFPYTLLYLTLLTTVSWIAVTFLTRPEPLPHLVRFYGSIRPGGPGWRPIAKAAGLEPAEPIAGLLVDWVAGCALVYSSLFGMGTMLLRSAGEAVPYFLAASAAGVVIYRDLSRRGWESVMK
jgi:SSS family transporter